MTEPTVQPGYYSDITNAEYHDGPGISKSHLHDTAAPVMCRPDFLHSKGMVIDRTIAISSGPDLHGYAVAPGATAIGRRNALLVEASPEQECPWQQVSSLFVLISAAIGEQA